MRVIGTAGHVDHGKSTLVKALTGINPDRLKEEQLREMTIELGFAWMTLPNGEEVGIVDVPGHRDFIENMLAGVGGIDAVVFVVAADEGVMPQTREHLAILDLLQIPGGVVALTKTDMVDDPQWLDMVEEDLEQVFMGTVLEDAPVIRVSARNSTGIDQLLAALEKRLAKTPERLDLGRPRLSIDRVFTISGFGTVVTGTLLDGILSVGDEVEILPQGLRGRVRGLQTHKKKEERAFPGTRTAVNVSGIDVDQIQRGNVLVRPGLYKTTRRADVYFHLLPDVAVAMRHNMPVKVFCGAAETTARVRLLGKDSLEAGQNGWLQLEMENPLVLVRHDRYIIRRPSPGETLGGGEVIDAHPARRHKRFSQEVLTRLETLKHGTPEELLLQASLQSGPATQKELREASRLSVEQFDMALQTLRDTGDLFSLTPTNSSSGEVFISKNQWNLISTQMLQKVEQYHQKYPLRPGMPREELKSKLGISARYANHALAIWLANGNIAENKQYLCAPGFSIQFTSHQQKSIDALLNLFTQDPFSPPSIKECQQQVGEDLFSALLDTGILIQLNNEVVFRMTDYEKLVDDMKSWFADQDTITVAQFRDHYQTSRRYALAFLEYLDLIGITARDGDLRRLR